MKNLQLLLDDFAHDLINHCARVENDEIVLPEEGLKVLIGDYLKDENGKYEVKPIFKFKDWINEETLQNDPIFWVITEEMIQGEAVCGLGRRLNEDELRRVFETWYDHDTEWNRFILMREAVDQVVKENE